jgi:hypothetical protein
MTPIPRLAPLFIAAVVEETQARGCGYTEASEMLAWLFYNPTATDVRTDDVLARIAEDCSA